MLTPGARLGAYEIVGPIGEGGMGQVFRATDTKLKRQVAIKILPPAVAADRDRLARFQREAEVLASLNHPHIAGIYGLEESHGSIALVMELVEGEDLSQRLARGAIPFDDALPIARQIAEALEAAHEQGIIHRDLKPANVKVRADGTVKVLDFGLAKALGSTGSSGASGSSGSEGSLANSPTITSPAMTQMGMILGTAAYMAPEQAKGKPVDRRADIWAFGCVLFEMLTGTRAYGGDDVTETLAKIVMSEPQWALLPAATPSSVQRLLRRCLQKDTRRRLDSASAARLELESAAAPEESTSASVAPTTPRQSAWAWAGWVVAALSIAAAAALTRGSSSAPEPPSFSMEVPSPTLKPGDNMYQFAISPDGSRLAHRIFENGEMVLSVQRLDQFDSVTLPGSLAPSRPIWSPDSRLVAYFSNGRLQISPVDGGAPRVVASGLSVNEYVDGSWNSSGVILYGGLGQAITRVSVSDGTQAPATRIDTAAGEVAHGIPRFLPDGVRFIYGVLSKSAPPAIFVGSLDGSPSKRLFTTNTQVEFAPPDLLLHVRAGTLMAQRLDVDRLSLVGDAIPIVSGVYAIQLAAVSVSSNGVLVYRPARDSRRQASWVDRGGDLLGRVGPIDVRNVRLSPDGRTLAFHRPDNGGDVWLTDLERGADTRLSLDPARDDNPVWSPDGKRIAFVSNRDGGTFNVYIKNAGGLGAEELVLKTGANKRLGDWTPDGAYLLYDELDDKTGRNIWMLPMTGDRQPVKLIDGPFDEGEPSLSPDGRWLAYASDESGTDQIYVQAFPKGDRKWRVSSTGSTVLHPRWSRNGKELFFDATGRMTVVSMTTSRDGITAGPEQQLFAGLFNLAPHNFDVSLDGSRLLAILNTEGTTGTAAPMRVVTNWTRLMRERSP